MLRATIECEALQMNSFKKLFANFKHKRVWLADYRQEITLRWQIAIEICLCVYQCPTNASRIFTYFHCYLCAHHDRESRWSIRSNCGSALNQNWIRLNEIQLYLGGYAVERWHNIPIRIYRATTTTNGFLLQFRASNNGGTVRHQTNSICERKRK